ncbi:MAG: thiol-disulfide oxidoreductase DCC [Bdellovibrio sp.]|nr:MAG: thiol-disulfide oxidoreductase DCC [Bdellovibrio sp.]
MCVGRWVCVNSPTFAGLLMAQGKFADRRLMPDRILFFDGHCNLCSSFVHWLIRRDRQLCFAALQGETARTLHVATVETQMADPTSLVYWRQSEVSNYSTAALQVIADVGGVWRIARVGLWVPLAIRDRVYRLVASHRYRIFGRRRECYIPTPEERARFLK